MSRSLTLPTQPDRSQRFRLEVAGFIAILLAVMAHPGSSGNLGDFDGGGRGDVLVGHADGRWLRTETNGVPEGSSWESWLSGPGQRDDHGDSAETATLLAIGPPLSGVLGDAADVDVFRIDLAGNATVDVRTTGRIDTRGELLDGSGALIASDDGNGPGGNNFAMEEVLDPGIYYLAVKGAPGAYAVNARLVDLSDHGDTEPASTLLTLFAEERLAGVSPRIQLGTSGRIWPSTADLDVFRLDVPHDGTKISVKGVGIRGTDIHASLADRARNQLAEDAGSGEGFLLEAQVDAGVYYVWVGGHENGNYKVLASAEFTVCICAVSEVVAGDDGSSAETSTLLEVGGPPLPGFIEDERDADVFRLDLVGHARVRFRTLGRTETRGELRDGSGMLIATDSGSGPFDNFSIEETLQAGVYYVHVTGATSGHYTVNAVVRREVPDQHGDTAATSTRLPLFAEEDFARISPNILLSTSGRISSTHDIDAFRLDVAHDGTAVAVRSGGSTALHARLVDSSLAELAFSDSNGSVLIEAELDAGIYYVLIGGHETGPYNVYARGDADVPCACDDGTDSALDPPGEDDMSVVPDEPSGARAYIPDANLADALARSLGKRLDAPILVSELAGLTSLELRNEGIRDLDGLQKAANLRSLDLRGNPVDDVSTLANLKELRELDLSRTDMTELSPLAGLTQLAKLDLHNNSITDLSPLAGLINLTELDLSYNLIQDLTPLSFLTGLRVLRLRDNLYRVDFAGSASVPYLSLAPLAPLTNLTVLDLGGSRTRVNDGGWAALSNLTGLVELDLSGTSIGSVVHLSGLAKLESLDLSGNGLADLAPLAGLGALRSLKLNDNRITDLAPLSTLANLRVLELDENVSNSDIRPLAHMTSLTTLRLSANDISDLSPLAGLTRLQVLDLSSNAVNCKKGSSFPDEGTGCIRDIGALSGLVDLTDLDLGGIAVRYVDDLFPLAGLVNLVSLRLEQTTADISPLASLRSLQRLDLRQSQVADLRPLASVKSLKRLDLSFSQVADIGPLSELTGLDTLILQSIQHEYIEAEGRRPRRVLLSDLSPLSGLTSLTTLDLSSNHIEDLSPLASLTALTWLDLSENAIVVNGAPVRLIRDLSPLRNLTALNTLVLARNKLDGTDVDVTPLSELGNLDTLNLAENCIFDLSPLTANPALGRSSTINTHVSLNCREARARVQVDQQLAPIRQREGREAPLAEVLFLDRTLRSAIEDHLGKTPGEPITRRDMATLKSLDLRGERVAHLDGLRYAVNLEELDLQATLLGRFKFWTFNATRVEEFNIHERGADVFDLPDPLQDLSKLTKLRRLNLRRSSLDTHRRPGTCASRSGMSNSPEGQDDLCAVSALTRLTTLDLSQNNVTDLQPLSALRALRDLDLSDNLYGRPAGHDLSPLSALMELRYLNLGLRAECLGPDANCVEDLNPLSGLTKLASLNLEGHRITDLSPLSGLTVLATLSLRNNTAYGGARLVDLTPLAGLSALESLDVGHNFDIRDLSPLEALDNLRSLDLRDAGQLVDISPLANLRELTELNLDGTSVRDLSPLTRLSKLEVLAYQPRSEEGAPPPDLSPVSRLRELRELTLTVKQVDVSPLSGLPKLERLVINIEADDGVRLSNLAALATLICRCNQILLSAMPRLKVLQLEGGVSDVSSLAGLTSLESLSLVTRDNADLAALSNLTNLKSLSLIGAVRSKSATEVLSNLKGLEALRLDLYLPGDQVDYSFLTGLTNLVTLDLSVSGGGAGLTVLPPLERLDKLVELNLRGRSVADLTPLVNLGALKVARIDSGGTALDLSPLGGIQTLELLELRVDPETDLSPLSGLPVLETLYAEGTDGRRLDDISLSNLPALTSLQIQANGRVSLSDLPTLRGLTVSGRSITLSNLPGARTVSVAVGPRLGETARLSLDGSFASLSSFILRGELPELSLAGLPLEVLTLAGSRLTRLSLDDMPQLRGLDLHNNAVEELALAKVPKLGRIDLSGNEMTSLSLDGGSVLGGLPELRELDLSDNGFTGKGDLELANLPLLSWIDLERNAVEDLSWVRGLDYLQTLLLRYNSVANIEPLSGLPRLYEIDLEGNMVRGLEPLQGLRRLRRIDLDNNRVEDLLPLVENEAFRGVSAWLFVRYNPLSKESLEAHIPVLRARQVNVRW